MAKVRRTSKSKMSKVVDRPVKVQQETYVQIVITEYVRGQARRSERNKLMRVSYNQIHHVMDKVLYEHVLSGKSAARAAGGSLGEAEVAPLTGVVDKKGNVVPFRPRRK